MNFWFLVFHWQYLPDCQSSLVKLNLNDKLVQPECVERTSGEEIPQIDCLNRKEKNLESDLLESGCQEKVGWKKDVSSPEASSSMTEKEMIQAKTKAQILKTRHTQSGPLVPGAVLSHSLSERGQSSERFVRSSAMYSIKTLNLRFFICDTL